MKFHGLARIVGRTIILAALLALLPATVSAEAVASSGEGESFLAVADRHAGEGQNFLAVKEYRQAIAFGRDGSDVRWRLSLALYGLGLLDEAINEIDKAQQLAPDANYLHLPTGILHLAKGDLAQAAQHFTAALEINPGFADAYYYLGEVYYREGDYPRAWLCCLTARTLGHPGGDLQQKLEAVSAVPPLTPWRQDHDVLCLRAIQVASREEAQSVLDRITAGELFEYIAAERGTEANQGFGGYVGLVLPAELDPAITAALLDREVYHPPLLLEVAGGYQILQRIAPFDTDYWDQLLASAKKLAPATALTTRTTGSAVNEGNPYLLYAGSYGSETSARKRLTELEKHGFSASLSRQESPSGKNIHVVAGHYASQKEAQVAANQLKRLGIDHYISSVKGRIQEPRPLVRPAAPSPAPAAVHPEPVVLAPASLPAPRPATEVAAPPVQQNVPVPEVVPQPPLPPVSPVATEIAAPAALPIPPAEVAAALVQPVAAQEAEFPVTAAAPTAGMTLPPIVPEPSVMPVPVTLAVPEQTKVSSGEQSLTQEAATAPAPETTALLQAGEACPSASICFRLLAGVYATEFPATQRVQELQQQGFPSYLLVRGESGGKSFMAVAGNYANRQEALAAAAKLEALGGDPLISEWKEPKENHLLATGQPAAATIRESAAIPVANRSVAQGNRQFRVHAGSFSGEANAQKKLAELEQYGFSGYIFRQETPAGKSFHVVAGKYATRQEAVEAAARLETLRIEHYISGGK